LAGGLIRLNQFTFENDSPKLINYYESQILKDLPAREAFGGELQWKFSERTSIEFQYFGFSDGKIKSEDYQLSVSDLDYQLSLSNLSVAVYFGDLKSTFQGKLALSYFKELKRLKTNRIYYDLEKKNDPHTRITKRLELSEEEDMATLGFGFRFTDHSNYVFEIESNFLVSGEKSLNNPKSEDIKAVKMATIGHLRTPLC
jgi:hypothetical protein